MKLSPAEQEQIVKLLTRIYTDICAIETDYGLLTGDGDFRPRIDYFHDAIRAFTSGDDKARETGGRLTVEYLAYDLGCLRYLQAMPLSPFKPQAANLAPGTDMVKLEEHIVPTPRRPSRAVKEQISELYQNYAMLFAALLKPFADADYQERTDDIAHNVAELGSLVNQIEGLASGTGAIEQIANQINHLEDDELRKNLLAFLQQGGFRQKPEIAKLVAYLKARSNKKDGEIKAIDKAHLDYSTAQLAIYEGSRDTLKKMAAQGMNLVGKFVESSIAQTRREMGR